MGEIILTTKTELRGIMRSVIIERENELKAKEPGKVYSINHIAKKLGMAHATVKKLVLNGAIKSTKSGLITEDAINKYLNG